MWKRCFILPHSKEASLFCWLTLKTLHTFAGGRHDKLTLCSLRLNYRGIYKVSTAKRWAQIYASASQNKGEQISATTVVTESYWTSNISNKQGTASPIQSQTFREDKPLHPNLERQLPSKISSTAAFATFSVQCSTRLRCYVITISVRARRHAN